MLYLTELRLEDNLLASSPLVRPKAYAAPTPRLLTLSELRTRFAKPTGIELVWVVRYSNRHSTSMPLADAAAPEIAQCSDQKLECDGILIQSRALTEIHPVPAAQADFSD